MQSMSENDFECLASTGVNTPGAMFPNPGFGEYWVSWKLTYGPRLALCGHSEVAADPASNFRNL
jgi:hypothetical protein